MKEICCASLRRIYTVNIICTLKSLRFVSKALQSGCHLKVGSWHVDKLPSCNDYLRLNNYIVMKNRNETRSRKKNIDITNYLLSHSLDRDRRRAASSNLGRLLYFRKKFQRTRSLSFNKILRTLLVHLCTCMLIMQSKLTSSHESRFLLFPFHLPS